MKQTHNSLWAYSFKVSESHLNSVVLYSFGLNLLVTTNSMISNITHEIIRILHECQVWIDKSVLRVTFWLVMPNCDTRDRFVYTPYTHDGIFFLHALMRRSLIFILFT